MRSHFAGASLHGSHFEGADLEESHFEGVCFSISHFVGANLKGSHFEGADDDTTNYRNDFKLRIGNRIGEKAEIEDKMFFSGGIPKEYIRDIEKVVKKMLPYFLDTRMANSFQKRMDKVIEILEAYQYETIRYKIPKKFKDKNFLGELTEKRASEIIQKHDKIIQKRDEIIQKRDKINKKYKNSLPSHYRKEFNFLFFSWTPRSF